MSMTKQARSWILTLPADTYDQTGVEEALKNYTYAGQLEQGKGENGYQHWQIYIENENPIKFSTLQKKFPRGHFEVRMGTKKQAYDYVTKSDTSMGVTISNGEIDLSDEKGKRSDLLRLESEILLMGRKASELILTEPGAVRYARYLDRLERERDRAKWSNVERDPLVRYLSGPARSGKTRGLLARYGANAFRVTDYNHPFDSYNGESVLLLDEFRSQLDFSLMLNVLAGQPFELPARYENRWAAYSEVWVVSNRRLEQQYKDVQREHPEDWTAFVKRFHTVERLDGSGVVEDVSGLYDLDGAARVRLGVSGATDRLLAM